MLSSLSALSVGPREAPRGRGVGGEHGGREVGGCSKVSGGCGRGALKAVGDLLLRATPHSGKDNCKDTQRAKRSRLKRKRQKQTLSEGDGLNTCCYGIGVSPTVGFCEGLSREASLCLHRRREGKQARLFSSNNNGCTNAFAL